MKTAPSLLFAVAVFVWTAILAVLYLPFLVLPRRVLQKGARFWIKGIMRLLALTVSLTYEIRGKENLSQGPCILASKHQSAWDTLVYHLLLDDPTIVLKKELFLVPFFGWYLRKAGMIGVDRSAGTKALKTMVRGSETALAQGRQIIVFPEGTRTAPGTHRSYLPGVAALYRHLEVPVVPVALNSGLFWGRRAFVKRPGTILLQFLSAIPAGLARDDFMAELERRIETATARLEGEARSGPESEPRTAC